MILIFTILNAIFIKLIYNKIGDKMKLKYILIIPILFVLILIFSLKDTTINNINNKRDTFDYMFVKSDGLNNLVSLSGMKKNEEVTIIELEDYQTILYDYVEDNIFLYLEKTCSNCEYKYALYQINLLNQVYKPVLIKDLTMTEYTALKGSVQYYDNSLLFKSNYHDYILKLDLSNKEITTTPIKIDNKQFEVYQNKGLLIYHLNNNIYEYNLIYDKNNLLFEQAELMFLKNDKFIYGEWTSSINYKTLKEYSYITNKIRRIAIDKPNETYIDSLQSIYPTTDKYVYIASKNLINIIDINSNIKPYLTLSFNPDAIMHLGDNHIWIYQYPNKQYIYDIEKEELSTYKHIISNIKYKK
jgi:hypothetical protein